ncbi:hypothetical protein [Enterobacter sp. CPE_E1214]|uniref:hypothetical protein n=1 Tax=unclassified Enterobacter TaxID=2608935 RepID=UPI003890A914
MDESRKQFQKWWEEFYETSTREPWDVIYSPDHDYFVDQDIDGQYDAWKASRAAIEIVLDKEITNVTNKYYEEGRDDVIEAIRAAGIKVKE